MHELSISVFRLPLMHACRRLPGAPQDVSSEFCFMSDGRRARRVARLSERRASRRCCDFLRMSSRCFLMRRARELKMRVFMFDYSFLDVIFVVIYLPPPRILMPFRELISAAFTPLEIMMLYIYMTPYARRMPRFPPNSGPGIALATFAAGRARQSRRLRAPRCLLSSSKRERKRARAAEAFFYITSTFFRPGQPPP